MISNNKYIFIIYLIFSIHFIHNMIISISSHHKKLKKNGNLSKLKGITGRRGGEGRGRGSVKTKFDDQLVGDLGAIRWNPPDVHPMFRPSESIQERAFPPYDMNTLKRITSYPVCLTHVFPSFQWMYGLLQYHGYSNLMEYLTIFPFDWVRRFLLTTFVHSFHFYKLISDHLWVLRWNSDWMSQNDQKLSQFWPSQFFIHLGIPPSPHCFVLVESCEECGRVLLHGRRHIVHQREHTEFP